MTNSLGSMVRVLALVLVGLGPAQAESMQDWAAQAARDIHARYRPPPGYRHTKVPFVTTVRFVVSRDGAVSKIEVTEKSGVTGLDDAAARAVRDAQPLRPPPLAPEQDNVVATIPVSWQ